LVSEVTGSMTVNSVALLAQSQPLASQRFFHAAIEVLHQGVDSPCLTGDDLATVLDAIGKLYAQLGYDQKALKYFRQALSRAQSVAMTATCEMHTANIYHRLSDFDRAHRMLQDIVRSNLDLSPGQLGAIYNNLASVQGQMGFYRDGIENCRASISYFREIHNTHALSISYHNLGLLHLEQHQYTKAEEYMTQVELLRDDEELAQYADMSRLFLQTSDLGKAATYLRKALGLVSSSLFNYSKGDVARICQLVAHFSYYASDTLTALRLVEKAQLLYGQLNMWYEFEQMQKTLDQWQTDTNDVRMPMPLGIGVEELHQLLTLLDVVNAQEYLHPRMSMLLDARVLYADALATALDLEQDQREALTYACRFADYGLTALELEVVENPKRSPQALNQYQQHPLLSVKMLEPLGLNAEIMEIIAHHHESFDGTGFPAEKSGNNICPSAQILAVADFYASGVTMDEKPHSTVIAELQSLSGRRFDPEIVSAFAGMFNQSARVS
jgi:tetratricopeptide (TPR) repeat protein